MLINLSNHPFARWHDAQQKAALSAYEQVLDLQFPSVDPEASPEEIVSLARHYAEQCKDASNQGNIVVHVMGEMTFTHAFVRIMQLQHVTCIASTSKRKVTVLPDGDQKVSFNFVRFRTYPSL